MISERQQDANRRNAAKSHGPITPEGRAAVCHNALKHGFTAAEIVLPTVEEQIDFEQFRAAFEAEHQPVGPTEQVLVEDIVIARWRLNRIRKMEPGFFALRREVLKDTITEFSTLDPQAQLALIVLDDARDTDTYRQDVPLRRLFRTLFLQSAQRVTAASSPPRSSVRFWEWDGILVVIWPWLLAALRRFASCCRSEIILPSDPDDTGDWWK